MSEVLPGILLPSLWIKRATFEISALVSCNGFYALELLLVEAVLLEGDEMRLSLHQGFLILDGGSDVDGLDCDDAEVGILPIGGSAVSSSHGLRSRMFRLFFSFDHHVPRLFVRVLPRIRDAGRVDVRVPLLGRGGLGPFSKMALEEAGAESLNGNAALLRWSAARFEPPGDDIGDCYGKAME